MNQSGTNINIITEKFKQVHDISYDKYKGIFRIQIDTRDVLKQTEKFWYSKRGILEKVTHLLLGIFFGTIFFFEKFYQKFWSI